ncbi:hypothetical protein Taro_014474 [Colocasia esculenta]|uniref:Neprosin PEP catalytic domain-containing protein n=1 Tax=Colocasia esculenta TaxID=4460 RepID=A0A843UJ61_COLES|nr:hypothetical protein [Colocasia esculenta]
MCPKNFTFLSFSRSVSTHRQTVSTPLASTVLTASWDNHLVSTHRWTMSTPLASTVLTTSWDSYLVSTHRWTVSTPLVASFRICFCDSHLVSTHRSDFLLNRQCQVAGSRIQRSLAADSGDRHQLVVRIRRQISVASAIGISPPADQNSEDWWVMLEEQLLGYWPKSLVPKLEDGAQIHNFGGEIVNTKVSGHHTSTQMGSGHFAEEGYTKSAYIKNIQLVEAHDRTKYISPEHGNPVVTHPNCYDLHPGNVQDLQWGFHFFFGGPGRSATCT